MDVRAWLGLGLGMLALGCGSASYRNPTFVDEQAPSPTLLTGVVSCLAPVEVAAAGRRVRRAAQLGEKTVRALEERLARIGPKAPQLPTPTCAELTSDGANAASDWSRPPPPLDLGEVLELAGAKSLLVSVVSSEVRCVPDETAWRWGEPTYEDASGEVDCHEHRLVLSSFLYGADGTLLWKATVDEKLDMLIDPADLANELLRDVPVEATANLSGPAAAVPRHDVPEPRPGDE